MEELKLRYIFLNVFTIEALLFGDDTLTDIKIFNFQICTSNKQNISFLK
jgi:hypothetical protein